MNIKRIGLIGGSGVGGGTSSGGNESENSIWRIDNGLLISSSSNRSVQLGTDVVIGSEARVVIGGNGGILVQSTQGEISIGRYTEIGGDTSRVTINNSGISIIDSSYNLHLNIGENFNTNDYFNIPTKQILPSAIPFESQSNGNIKIGDTLFMPATPSGDPLHYAYETAGAVYNATTDFIIKDAPWKDMVDTIEDKAKWGFDVVEASQIKQMTIGGTTYNYVQTTRQSPEGTTEPRYFLVGQASDGTWVEDETKVLHLPGHWYLVGLGDITNKEMRRILDEKEVKYRWDKTRGGQRTLARTVIPVNNTTNIDMIPKLATPYDIYAESICITSILYFKTAAYAKALSVSYTGTGNKTRYIQTCKDASGTPFSNACVVSFVNLTQNCNISNVPLLSKPSILHTIDTATPTTAIIITLHADRYAQLAEDADIVAALEAKNTALEGTGGSISLVSA